ncbi:hypothetical protein Tco_0448546 [Tanacetum coccineum]
MNESFKEWVGWPSIVALGSGYHQKDRKPSQNDKTEHGMEKTVQIKAPQSPKIPKSESKQKISSQTESEQKILLDAILTHLMDRKANSNIYEDVKTKMGPSTAHLCAIDKDCEDFEGPILAQLQPISAIVHTKPT